MAPDPATAAVQRTGAERWASIGVRSVHLAAVVWLGAFVLTARMPTAAAAWWVALSGALLLAMDLRAHRVAVTELAGALVLVKLGLVGWMALDVRQATWIFWTLLIVSSVVAHAPKGVRHWPRAMR